MYLFNALRPDYRCRKRGFRCRFRRTKTKPSDRPDPLGI